MTLPVLASQNIENLPLLGRGEPWHGDDIHPCDPSAGEAFSVDSHQGRKTKNGGNGKRTSTVRGNQPWKLHTLLSDDHVGGGIPNPWNTCHLAIFQNMENEI
jgi:hypothetical protein